MQNLKSIFLTSLRLGLTSFGGPIAHLGYFEHTYVKQRRWLNHDEFSHLVALCQLLPGPTSSQINFLIGMQRGGWMGAFLSFVAFTLPSALLMYLFAVFVPQANTPAMQAALHGLKLAAVIMVAQAVWSMAVRLCPDRARTGIALAAMSFLLIVGGALAQVCAILFGAVAGWRWSRDVRQTSLNQKHFVGKRTAWAAFFLFFVFLAVLPVLSFLMPGGLSHLLEASYRSGALVFGGGHVVLPLLRDAMVPTGMMTDEAFLAGYGAAQALPGPLFALSSYLGAAVAPTDMRGLWAMMAVVFIFLPGFLAALAGIPLWGWISRHPRAQGAFAGINASVVGILAAALYDPVWQTAILGKPDVVIAVTGYFLLEKWKCPPVLVVALCVSSSILASIVFQAGP